MKKKKLQANTLFIYDHFQIIVGKLDEDVPVLEHVGRVQIPIVCCRDLPGGERELFKRKYIEEISL